MFSEVLDVPGGMRIGTIHAFCQSLLRRFPLEARNFAAFQVVEDRDAEEAMREARETMLAEARPGADAGGVARHSRASRPLTSSGAWWPGWALNDSGSAMHWPSGRGSRRAQRRALGATAADRDAIIAGRSFGRREDALRKRRSGCPSGGAGECAETAGRCWTGLRWSPMLARRAGSAGARSS